MAEKCLPHVHACAMAVTLLSSDGSPVVGASNRYVTDALTRLGFAWEVEEGDQIREKNACGAVKVDYRAPADLVRGNLTIELVTPDPYLESLLSDGTVLTPTGDRVGFAAPPLGPQSEMTVGIEVWAKRILDGKLDPDFPYAWWLYPWVTKLRPGDHEHAQANLARSFVGEAYENAQWLDGPLNDWPVASDAVYQWIPTTTIPTTQCGFVAVASS